MDSPRNAADPDGNAASVSLLGRNAALNREREPELTSIAMATLSPDSPSSHQQHDHAPLESRPSTASTSSQSKMSPLRALVRTLTPKRRKPILVKAGFRREHAPGEEERDLRVTFDLPRPSIASVASASSTANNKHTHLLDSLKTCCDRPLISVAGVLSLVGGISFGYDMGITTGMMDPIREKFHLTCAQEQVLLGCVMGGAVIVSICGGPWIDKCGRRRAILISSFFFILGSGLCGIVPSLDTMSAGRLLQGFGMSMAVISQCIYMSEIAPKDKRGFMVGLNELGITIGFILAFICGYILHGVANSWRVMMAIGAVPAVLQFLGTFFFLPPSPRERMMNKYDKEAILILDNLRGNRNEAMNEFASIRHSLVIESSYGTLSLFRSQGNLLFRLLVGLSLVFLQQLCGLASVLYYSKTIFEQAGVSIRWSSLAIFGLGVVRLISTAITLSLTDKHGRRFFLVLGCLLMSGALAVVGISTVVRPHDIPKVCERNLSEIVYRHPAELDNAEREATASPVTSSIINGTLSWKTVISSSPTLSPSSASSLPVVTTMDGAHVAQLVVNFLALIVFMVGYAIGFGPMTFLVLSELYPAGVKGRAMSFCNFVGWSLNLILSLTFLHALNAFTPGGLFLIFCLLNLFSASYIFLVVPETEGKSLEKISYELRSVRPKQRFDANLQKLCPFLKSRSTQPGLVHGEDSPADRDALI